MKKWQQLEQVMGLGSEQISEPKIKLKNVVPRIIILGNTERKAKAHGPRKLADLCEHRITQSSARSESEIKGSALLQFFSRYGNSKCVDAKDKVYGP